MAADPGSVAPHAREQLPTLQSLRGFAALSVVLFHLTGAGMPRFEEPITRSLFQWGWVGVDIFFVISGFIIPWTMLRDRYRLRDYGRFLGRRLLRVGPPSWAVVFLTVAAAFGIDALRGGVTFWSAGIGWPRILHNLAYTIPFTGYGWINPVFWTLAVEFQFYVLAGLAVPFAFRDAFRFIFVALLAMLLHYAPLPKGMLFFAHAPIFLLGGAALLYREKRIGLSFYLPLLAALVVAAALQVGLIQAAFGCATALLISFVRIDNPIGDFFGRISYSLYLVHPLVGAFTALALIRVIAPSDLPAKLLIIVAAIAASLIAAWIFNVAVERPAISLARRTFRLPGRSDAEVQPAL